MKILIIVRHGSYNFGTGKLSNYGGKQIMTLSDKLKPLLKGMSGLILSSTAPRAKESADLLSSSLFLTVEEHDLLWSDDERGTHLPDALALVLSHQGQVDALVLVTHLEYAGQFPPYFMKRQLGVDVPQITICKGEALVIDCAKPQEPTRIKV